MPTPDFPEGSACPNGSDVPVVVFTEDFDGGFGVFSEDPAPGGDNELRESTAGDTPSGGTGPETTASCVGTTNEGEFIFLEGTDAMGGEVHCMSTTVDLTALSPPLTLSFWYHMFGLNIGELTVNVDSNEEFSVTGQQHTANGQAWLQGLVDLSAYAGSSVSLQICMSEGDGSVSTFQSDISIDHIQIFNDCVFDGLNISAFKDLCGRELTKNTLTNCADSPETLTANCRIDVSADATLAIEACDVDADGYEVDIRGFDNASLIVTDSNIDDPSEFLAIFQEGSEATNLCPNSKDVAISLNNVDIGEESDSGTDLIRLETRNGPSNSGTIEIVDSTLSANNNGSNARIVLKAEEGDICVDDTTLLSVQDGGRLNAIAENGDVEIVVDGSM